MLVIIYTIPQKIGPVLTLLFQYYLKTSLKLGTLWSYELDVLIQ
jgi:hypothetical protein